MGVRRTAFTLLELMVVVAIIAVLAAVAVPLMRDYQLRAESAEAYTNVEGIADAGTGYGQQVGNISTSMEPRATTLLDKQLAAWPTTTSFLGAWEPDGPVRCAYWLAVNGGVNDPTANPFTVQGRAYCDLDDDDVFHRVDSGNYNMMCEAASLPGGKCGNATPAPSTTCGCW